MAITRQSGIDYGGKTTSPGTRSSSGSNSGWSAGDSTKRAGAPLTSPSLGNTAVNASKAGVQSVINAQNTPTYTPSYSSGGGTSYVEPEQPDYSAWFNALTSINNSKYDALKQAILSQKQRADEMNNMNYARNLREWRKMYADRRNGQGLSNRLNINYNRDNTARAINETFDTNNLNALSGRYTDLASLTGQLPNMNNETIKKIMSAVGSWSI